MNEAAQRRFNIAIQSAVALYQAKDFDGVRDFTTIAMRQSLTNATAWKLLGAAAAGQNNQADAVLAFRIAALLGERDPDVLQRLAATLRNGEHPAIDVQWSSDLLRDAIDVANDNPPVQLALLQGQLLSLETLERKVREELGRVVNTGDSYEDLFFNHIGDRHLLFAEQLESFVARNPNKLAAQYMLASVRFALGKWEAGEQLFQQVYERNPSYDRAHTTRLLPAYFERLDAIGIENILERLPALSFWKEQFEQDRPVLYLSCDPNYFYKFGIAMITSIDINSPDVHLHINFVNADPQYQESVKSFLSRLRNVSTNASFDNFDFTDKPRNFVLGYYASCRLARCYQCLERYQQPIMNLDVDGLNMNNARPYLESVRKFDVVQRIRPGRFDPWNQVDAAAVVINPTDAGRAYLRLVAGYVGNFALETKSSWMMDQISLYMSTIEMGRRGQTLNIGMMPEHVLDLCKQDGAVFWKTAGRQKFEQEAAIRAVGKAGAPALDRYSIEFKKFNDFYMI
jgi:tetratricopeptide (TPR) repeat protein